MAKIQHMSAKPCGNPAMTLVTELSSIERILKKKQKFVFLIYFLVSILFFQTTLFFSSIACKIIPALRQKQYLEHNEWRTCQGVKNSAQDALLCEKKKKVREFGTVVPQAQIWKAQQAQRNNDFLDKFHYAENKYIQYVNVDKMCRGRTPKRCAKCRNFGMSL